MSNINDNKNDSIIEGLTGFSIKEFVIIIAVAYLSILTLPAVVASLNLPPLIVVVGVMCIQYLLLYFVGKNHESSILKTMTSNGFLGWLMWLALVCMLMLPVIHLITLSGIISINQSL
jgi:hypothetical protein